LVRACIWRLFELPRAVFKRLGDFGVDDRGHPYSPASELRTIVEGLQWPASSIRSSHLSNRARAALTFCSLVAPRQVPHLIGPIRPARRRNRRRRVVPRLISKRYVRQPCCRSGRASRLLAMTISEVIASEAVSADLLSTSSTGRCRPVRGIRLRGIPRCRIWSPRGDAAFLHAAEGGDLG